MTTLVETVPPRPVIRSITAEDVYAAWARAGRTSAPCRASACSSAGVYALVGVALLLTLWAVDRPA